MEGSLSEFAITTTKERPRSPSKDRGVTESIQKRCRRTSKKHDFGDDILLELLILLPPKSLMRFKCVSKTWNTLIQHPNFVKSHNAHSRTRPSATRLLLQLEILPPASQATTSLIPTPQPEGLSLQLAPHHYCSDTRSEMVICSNHCNGLVCVYNNKDTQVYLYNVTTGEIKALPFSLQSSPDSGTNSWREIPEKNSSTNFSSRCNCIFLNGVLYWTDLYCDIDYFDIREEKFGTLSPPRTRNYGFDELSKTQTALQGKLVLSWFNFYRRGDKVYSVYDEVTKVFKNFNSIRKLEKVTLPEAERIDKTKIAEVLATMSLISAPTFLEFPDCFLLSHASTFVENIMPLNFIDDF
ncbi:putative F-box protein At1g32420 [Lycium ferocissimum]|uniref:putative F-box protein At1g32420 n=1 Tax=Lycium ferocissimum TaxID=112874 RepID=UPI002816210E|nr:putative F-box protein At1g32420 [Lycium ferocissimum]